MSIASQIIVDELIEQGHIVDVEDVIYKALKEYCKINRDNWNGSIAFAISKRIEEAIENETPEPIMNPELVGLLKI